jgi:CheY-like chemotaxis protein
VLTQAGLTAEGAGDGPSGLELLKTQKFDLILLDLILPGLDGFGILSIIKNDPATKGIPVLIISGRDSEPERLEAIKLGAQNCLVKHRCPPVEIVKIVKNTLQI